MRDINVTKYRKILQEIQFIFSSTKSELNKGYFKKDKLTDFERGCIVGQHKAYKDVLKMLDMKVAVADFTWDRTHCREERWEKDEV